MNGVGLTSLWTAAMRAVESERADALFSDPFAARLAGEAGFKVLRAANEGRPRPPSVEVRTRFDDDRIVAAVARGIRQIVALAAGMDTRAYRLALPTDTTFFEIDQVEVLDHKRSLLTEVSPTCDRREVAIDLREDWPAALKSAGFQPAPTIWVVEGLVHYLDEADVRAIFARIDALAATGDVLLFDVVGRSLLASPYMTAHLARVAELGAPWIFGTDQPEELLTSWDTQVHDVSAIGNSFGRWPFPTMERNTPGAPHSFLVEATKR